MKITKKRILNYAALCCRRCQETGHSDARILAVNPDGSVRIHAGTVDAWHPCGSNETIDRSIVRLDVHNFLKD